MLEFKFEEKYFSKLHERFVFRKLRIVEILIFEKVILPQGALG